LKKKGRNKPSESETKTIAPVQSENEQHVLATALSDISMALNSTLNLDEVLDQILVNLAKVVPNKTSNIMLLNGTLAHVVRSKGYDLLGTKEILHSRIIDINNLLNFKAMRATKKPILTADTLLDKTWHFFPESAWVRSHISAPILFEYTVIGFINCDSDVPAFYNAEQRDAIQLFANQAGLAIRNARLYNASLNHGKKLRLINDLTHQILEAKTLGKVLELLPDKMTDLFEADNVYISKWDEETRTASGWAVSGDDNLAYLEKSSLPGEKTLTEYILTTGHSTLVRDLQNSGVMDQSFFPLYKEKTILALPLISQGEKLGSINLGYKSPDLVTEDVVALGEYTAVQISTAIVKNKTIEHIRNQSFQLEHAKAIIETLSRVASTVKSGVGTSNVMTTIGNELEKLKIHSLVALLDANEDDLTLAYSSLQGKIIPFLENFSGVLVSELKTPMSKNPILIKTIAKQKTQFVEDPPTVIKEVIPSFLRPLAWKLLEAMEITKVSRGILVPLVVETKSIGILCIWGESLQEIDVEAAAIFGDQMSIAIENASLIEKIQQLAITDDLTGVLNRRGFNEIANREYGIAIRYNRPLSLVMLDIDHFKIVNDTYGHPVGDEVLQELTFRCVPNIRDIDVFSRFGGEEFLILLTESNLKNANRVAERIRNNVASQPFSTSVGEIIITISLGVVESDPECKSIAELINLADRALYISKDNGRNRISNLTVK
jgi:diguanylate cyclase (GGDEF)-like protein